MNVFTAMRIGASGLAAQRLRMNVIASNLANAHSTRTLEGGPYRRKDVFFLAVPAEAPAAAGVRPASFQETLARELRGVRVAHVVEDRRPPRRVYDPGHPDADRQGYVLLPNINVIEEMVNLMAAARGYEAGVTAMTAARNMALKALEIGR